MTYLQLNAVFVAVAVVVALVALRRAVRHHPAGARTTRPAPAAAPGTRRWWAASGIVVVVLVVLTVVFDSIMIWADLFRFDDQHMSGITVWLAPLEDLAWPLAAAILLPAVHAGLGRKDRP